MVEGSSSKFWEVSVEGASYTVKYGRIGTSGVAKTTSCASPAAAQAEADKLVREKTKKGYQELGAAVENWRPPTHMSADKHIERFMNYKVSGFDPEADEEGGEESERRDFPSLRDLEKRVFRIGLTYDGGDFEALLDALLADKKVGDLRGLVIGAWFSEVCEDAPEELFSKLIAHGSKLKALKGLFVGDIIQEECEISWLHQGNYSPMLKALPQLEVLVVRGGDGLRFEHLEHPALRELTVQTGGLSPAAVMDIAGAKLPELRELTLWLGVEEYGGGATVEHLAGLLSGDRFPHLEHLGLQNTEATDEIAKAIAKSPLLARLKGLDLSMGTLSDEGALALIAAPATRTLKHLNVRHHYLSPDVMKQLKGLGIEVNVQDRLDGDEEDGRYAEVTE